MLDRLRWPPCPCRQRAAHVARAASAVAPCSFSTAYLVEICNFASFSEFLHTESKFSGIFSRSSLRMTHMNHEKFHEKRSARFSEIRNTDTQTITALYKSTYLLTDRQSRPIYTVTWAGRSFHTAALEAVNVRLPTVDRRMIGTCKRSEPEERSRCRDGMSATRVKQDHFCSRAHTLLLNL